MPGPLKPRRTKSLKSFQHEDNKKSQWDSDDSDSDDKSSSAIDDPIFTLPDGITVRKFRRKDAKAIQIAANDPAVDAGYPDGKYPQPFSLWRAHKVIDEGLSHKESWRRQNPSSSPEDFYSNSLNAFEERDLDQRLAKRGGQFFAKPPPPIKEKYSQPKIPVYYCIAKDDFCIGLIESGVQDPVEFNSDDDDPTNPAFMQEAEICYWIAKEYRGRGIMTSVLQRWVQWVWENFAHVEIQSAATYSSWNRASGKVLRKCGFQSEAVWRGGIRKNGRFGNLHHYSIIRPGGKIEQARGDLRHEWVEDMADLPLRTTT